MSEVTKNLLVDGKIDVSESVDSEGEASLLEPPAVQVVPLLPIVDVSLSGAFTFHPVFPWQARSGFSVYTSTPASARSCRLHLDG